MVVKVRLQNAAAVKELLGRLTGPQAARAIAKGINDTAFAARKAYQDEVRRVFDRPTAFIVEGVYVQQATVKKPEALVQTTERARSVVTPAKVLRAQAEGGKRKAKRYERALQAMGVLPEGWVTIAGRDAPLDAHGNISGAFIKQILNQFKNHATRLPRNAALGSKQDRAAARKRINALEKAGGRYIVIRPGGRTQPGIYLRELIGKGLTPMLIFARAATYRQRISMEDVAAHANLEEVLHRRIRYRIYQTLEGKA